MYSLPSFSRSLSLVLTFALAFFRSLMFRVIDLTSLLPSAMFSITIARTNLTSSPVYVPELSMNLFFALSVLFILSPTEVVAFPFALSIAAASPAAA